MTSASVFQVANSLALIGWIILIVFPVYRTDKLLIGIFISLLAIVYTYIAINSFSIEDVKSFGSLEGVMSLFRYPKILLAGWIHYLAFDLMVGLWIKNNAFKLGINYWLVVPCLVFTFLLGPMGLLLYLVIRTIVTKRYFTENFNL
jgi:hypothetical protein